MRSRPRWALIGGAAALCAAMTAARSAVPTRDVVLSAYHRSISAKSARVTLRETVGIGGRTMSYHGQGAFDFRARKGVFSFTVAPLGTMQERLLYPEAYVRLPASLRSSLPGHKSWISVDLPKLKQTKMAASLAQVSSSGQAPTQTLSQLAAASNSVKKLGTADLGGVPTTEYLAKLDLSKGAAGRSAEAKAAISQLEKRIHRQTLPVRVWIDAHQRVRQISERLSLTVAGQKSTVAVTVGLSDYGTPVHVVAPPPGQILNLTKAMARAGAKS